jgi:uncharacterized protein (TIGR03790 family)
VLRIGSSGDAGVLLHDLGQEQSTFYGRFMLNAHYAGSGTLVLAGGINDAGKSSWQLVLDLSAQAVSLQIDQAELTVGLNEALDWQCIEVGLDVDSSAATLRLNGIERDSVTITPRPTRYAWLGGLFESYDFSGHLDLDHWAMATQPIGVRVSQPTQDHAGDPQRWLMIYNRDDADSRAWAATYRDRRGVPYANLCGLDLPTSETISAGQYETMRQQISDYLDDNHLRGQVVGVLLGYRVPGYADLTGLGAPTPISSYLQTDDTHGLLVVNPLYQSAIDQRPEIADYTTLRLTGRIDAPTLAEAVALIDRADDLVANPLSHDQGGNVLIDINPDNPNVGPVQTQPVADWANGQGLSQLRLPATVHDEAALVSVSGDAVVWGWRDAAPPAGFFGSPAGRRAICMQFDPEPDPADSLRDPDATHWLRVALDAGYAYAAAGSRAYAMSSLPLPHHFFEALRQGWTVAEAWLVAQAFLRGALQIVGDPLATIPFPKAGYDVFGPAAQLDLIDLDSPIALLHAGETKVPLDSGDLPAPGDSARYLVRAIDGQGRSDHASAAAFCAIEADKVVRPAMPAWPVDDDWPVLQHGGQLVLTAVWTPSLRSQRIESVQLLAQVGDDDPVIHEVVTPATGQRRVVFVIDHPTEPTRYRFAISQGPATCHSPWSAEVLPAADHDQSLTVLEASS